MVRGLHPRTTFISQRTTPSDHFYQSKSYTLGPLLSVKELRPWTTFLMPFITFLYQTLLSGGCYGHITPSSHQRLLWQELTMDYSPWSSKNLIDQNWPKKFMQVGIDVKCMHANFGGCDLYGCRDTATSILAKFVVQCMCLSFSFILRLYLIIQH